MFNDPGVFSEKEWGTFYPIHDWFMIVSVGFAIKKSQIFFLSFFWIILLSRYLIFNFELLILLNKIVHFDEASIYFCDSWKMFINWNICLKKKSDSQIDLISFA